jgi:hypothetical protein
VVDPQVNRTSFLDDSLMPRVVRGASPDARPMPLGPSGSDGGVSVTLHGWSRAPVEQLGQPRSDTDPVSLASPVAQLGPVGPAAPVGSAVAPLPTPTPLGPGAPGPQYMGTPGPQFMGTIRHGVFDCGDGAACNACPGDPCCSDGCCPDGCCYGSDNRFYVSAEYLLWSIKGDPTPPLVTRGSNGNPATAVLGSGTETVLFGGRDLGGDARSGGRINLGYWFGDQHLWGIDAGAFFLGRDSTNFSTSSFGNPAIGRPLQIATMGNVEGLERVADLAVINGFGPLAGTISASHNSSLWGADVNLRRSLLCGPNGYVDMLIGFRSLSFNEDLRITESLLQTNGSGASNQLTDLFQTQNRFWGGQVGWTGRYRYGGWTLDGFCKVALGTTQEEVNILGSQVSFNQNGGTPTARNFGLLAGPTNSGMHTRDTFSVVPELGFSLGYNVTDHVRCFAGYNFLYWSDVARAGEQIDRSVNQNNVSVGATSVTAPFRPTFLNRSSDFWAQGLTLGLEFKY